MTRLLVSVTNPAEAAAAAEAGADLIDAKDPALGALGALPLHMVRAIVAATGPAAEVSAATGDAPSFEAIAAMAGTGVAIVKTALPAGAEAAPFLAEAGRLHGGASRLVAVLPAGGTLDFDLVAAAAAAGFAGVMLDTVDKSAGLLDHMELADVARFVATARKAGLMVGLAGSLRVVDVGTLLPLQADVLGFRGGVCEGEDRRRPLDPARVRAVAAALKVHTARRAAGG